MDITNCFCINCFEDENIRGFIRSNGEKVTSKTLNCSFCQGIDWQHNEKYDIKDYDRKLLEKDFYIINQDAFNKKVIEIITKHFEYIEPSSSDENNELINLAEILNHKLFSGETTDILINLAKYDFIKYEAFPFNENQQLEYTDNTKKNYVGQENHWINCWKQRKNISWNEFKNHTKHKARFFDHIDSSVKISEILNPFNEIFESLKIQMKNEQIFRARIIYSDKDKQDIKKSPQEELGKAPIKIVKNNRFSPIGISYGYFAFDEETALNESRPELNQNIAIGTFKLEKNLKLVDFTKKHNFSTELSINILNPFDEVKFNILLVDIYDFITDISKPINEDDSLLEYVPTQIVSEYIWSLGYDGFIFDSSQKKDGKNLVLFGNNPTYIKHEFVKIKEKNIEYKYL